MSSDTHIYLGPYIICANRQIQTTMPIRACGTIGCPKCMKPSKSKFCPDCGTTIGEQLKGVTSREVEPDSINLDHRLTRAVDSCRQIKNGHDIFLPEHQGPREFNLHHLEATHMPLTPEDRDADLQWFEGYFWGEIQTLYAAYGVANCKLEWGVIVRSY